MQPTETRFLTRASAGPEQWQSAVSGYASDPIRRPVPLSDTNPDDCLVAHPADGRLRTILAPEDPVRMLLRHRAAVEQLRMAVGSRKLFEAHLMPAMAGWAAMVQGLPRDERGLWSGPDGLFEAGLMFARGAINAVDARVIGPELAPGIRDDWTLRLRIASALAGLMSDSRKLAALKLEAGSEDPATGTFTVTSRFNPSEETALSFCVHEIGRVMRLERHTARESAGRLPTLNADVLRLVVPRETLMWLGVIERPDGETVLTALKAAVTYAAGQTEAERLIAEAAARGREWAINRRAAEAARREGKSPLLRGFASVYRAEFSQRLYDGHWRLNRGDSPVVWADDGLALRWPEGFTAIAATADDKWLFRDVPDEPDVAAEILVADGFAMADEAGNPLWLTDSDCMAGEGAWLRLTDCDMHDGSDLAQVHLSFPWNSPSNEMSQRWAGFPFPENPASGLLLIHASIGEGLQRSRHGLLFIIRQHVRSKEMVEEEGIVGEGVDQSPLGAASLLLDAIEVAPVPVAHRLHELPVLS